MTPLDSAHAAMEAAPGDDARRLAFFRLFADAELFVMLAGEAEDDELTPSLFEVEGARYLVAFDREERLTGFTGQITPYAAMPGRGLVAMIAGEGIGIALNAELPSAMLLPPEAVNWLAETLGEDPGMIRARPQSIHAPLELPAPLMGALDQAMASVAGLADGAWLAGVTYEDGATGHFIGFVGAAPEAEAMLAGRVREALVFSGLEEGWLDVAFLAADDPIVAPLSGVGRAFDIRLPEPVRRAPSAPGTDPDRPPRLH